MGNPIFDGDSVPTEWRLEREREREGREGAGNVQESIQGLDLEILREELNGWHVVFI